MRPVLGMFVILSFLAFLYETSSFDLQAFSKKDLVLEGSYYFDQNYFVIEQNGRKTLRFIDPITKLNKSSMTAQSFRIDDESVHVLFDGDEAADYQGTWSFKLTSYPCGHMVDAGEIYLEARSEGKCHYFYKLDE